MSSRRTTGHYKSGDRVYLQGYPHITGTVLGPLVVGGLLGPEHRDRNYVLVRWEDNIIHPELDFVALSFHRATGWSYDLKWRIVGVGSVAVARE